MVTWLYYFSFQPDIKRKHIQQLEWRTICVYLSNHGCEEEEGERSSIHAGNYFLQRDGALLVLNRNCKKKFYWSKFRGVGGGGGRAPLAHPPKFVAVMHLFSSGHSVFDLQLQPNPRFFGYKMFLLCADNTDATLSIQMELTFNVFLLKILCRGFSFRKCLFESFRNIF